MNPTEQKGRHDCVPGTLPCQALWGRMALPELETGACGGLQPSQKAFATCHLGETQEAGEAEAREGGG